ncbi:MAG: RNA polymerase sigma factor [Firmicutes bacterium HGW-Firmicutes-16]|nr:MAG: RNA polymerase sigma factor [Firmicutes bacterium HGW-Firmicutes-16]
MFVTTEHNVALTKTTLEAYIAEIAVGDKAAVGALYEDTKTAVYGFALSILKNASDAEDVLQDTFVKIWSSAEAYSPLGKPMAWVLTITKNLSLSKLRERNRTTDISEDTWLLFQAENPTVNTEDRLVLNAAMQTLSSEERQIVVLHAVSGLKHVEIAQLLSLPLSTVLSKYNRAKKKLQNTLKEGK